MRVKALHRHTVHTRPVPSPTLFPLRRAAALLAIVLLAGCRKAPEPPSPAETEFNALVAACTRTVAARPAVVRPDSQGGWSKTGYSAALVQGEVQRTESPATPYVGKIVVKDNEARATAPTEAEASAITVTPAHLLANRTHTFIYSFDGTRWRWQNGMRLTKVPSQTDATQPLALADVPAGFAGCLPR